MLRFIIIASMVVYHVATARILNDPTPVTNFILGADRDEFGCIGTAGYSWCNHTQSCESGNRLCLPIPVPSLSSN